MKGGHPIQIEVLFNGINCMAAEIISPLAEPFWTDVFWIIRFLKRWSFLISMVYNSNNYSMVFKLPISL